MTSSDVTRPLPSLGTPLAVVWSRLLEDSASSTPVALGGWVVAAAGQRVFGLALDSGHIEWTVDLPGHAIDLVQAGGVAVVSASTDDGTPLVALTPSGEVQWRHGDGWAIGRAGLRGTDRAVLALGRNIGVNQRQTCQVLDAPSGRVQREVAVHGQCPFLHQGLLVFGNNVEAADQAGLFAVDRSDRTVRLHDAPAATLNVAEGHAVFHDGTGGGELIAVDLSARAESWRAPGGPDTILPVHAGQVAATQTREGGMVSVALRDLGTGEAVWAADPVNAWQVTLTLTMDLVLAIVDVVRLLVYDRANGALLQVLTHGSRLVDGLCVTSAGAINSFRSHIECLAGREAAS